MKQLISDNLIEMRITETAVAAIMHILDRDASPLECTAAGSWSVRTGEQIQSEVCCWLQEMPQGDMKERSWLEMTVEESQAAMKAKSYC